MQPSIQQRPPQPAILLLGPTGAGKTPLGEALEQQGFRGRRCAHFDFGAQLRAAVTAPATESRLNDADLALVRHVLASGRLLEDGQFAIAAALLEAFVLTRRLGPDDLLVLNGLPRHAGQATALEPFAHIEAVITLEGDPDTLHRRIAGNTGGDRTDRTDDSPAEVARKLALYEQRTAPLIGHYRQKGVSIWPIRVSVRDSAGDMRRQIPG